MRGLGFSKGLALELRLLGKWSGLKNQGRVWGALESPSLITGIPYTLDPKTPPPNKSRVAGALLGEGFTSSLGLGLLAQACTLIRLATGQNGMMLGY